MNGSSTRSSAKLASVLCSVTMKPHSAFHCTVDCDRDVIAIATAATMAHSRTAIRNRHSWLRRD
jgi:hypothetical protein